MSTTTTKKSTSTRPRKSFDRARTRTPGVYKYRLTRGGIRYGVRFRNEMNRLVEKSGFRSASEAKDYRRTCLAAIDELERLRVPRLQLTVSELEAAYRDSHWEELNDDARRAWSLRWRTLLGPSFGWIDVRVLPSRTIQRWIRAGHLEDGFPISSCRELLAQLEVILQVAVDLGAVDSNAVAGVTLPASSALVEPQRDWPAECASG